MTNPKYELVAGPFCGQILELLYVPVRKGERVAFVQGPDRIHAYREEAALGNSQFFLEKQHGWYRVRHEKPTSSKSGLPVLVYEGKIIP